MWGSVRADAQPMLATSVAGAEADVVFVAPGHTCLMRGSASLLDLHLLRPGRVPAVASSRSLFTKAFLFSSSSWLGMRPALPPAM